MTGGAYLGEVEIFMNGEPIGDVRNEKIAKLTCERTAFVRESFSAVERVPRPVGFPTCVSLVPENVVRAWRRAIRARFASTR